VSDIDEFPLSAILDLSIADEESRERETRANLFMISDREKAKRSLRIWGSDITKIVFANFIYLSFSFVLDSGHFNYQYKEA
jgi:hypothetical protein